MAGLVKSVELRILATDADAQAKLDAIAERAEELKAENPELAVRIDSAAASEKLRVLKDEFRDTAAAADDTSEALKTYQDAAARAASASDDLAKVQADDGASADDLAAAQDRATQATLAQLDAQMRLVGAEEKSALAGKENADAQEDAAGKTDLAAASGAEAGKRLNELALGAGAVAAGSVYMATKFQEGATLLVTGAGQSEKGLAAVKTGMLDLSTQTATSASDIEAGMYMVESAGFHGAQGLQVLKAAAEGAKVGNAQLADVANVVTSALNAYHLPASQAVAVTNEMVETTASGKMHMEDLASSISSVLPVAAKARISFAQVGGALATMTMQGMSAHRASMNLANMIRSLLGPSASASAEMKVLGLNANQVSDDLGSKGLTGTLQVMTEAILKNTRGGSVLAASYAGMSSETKAYAEQVLAGKLTTEDLTTATKGLSVQQAGLLTDFAKTAAGATGVKTTFVGALKTMTGGAAGLNTALLLTGKNAPVFDANVKAIAASASHAGANVQGWGDITKDTGYQLDHLKVTGEALAISVGSDLLPAVTDLLSPLASAAGWLADNKDAAMALAVVVGGILTTYLGVKAVGAFNAVKSAVTDVGTGLTWLGTKLGILSGEQEAENAATEASVMSTDELTASTQALRAEVEEQIAVTEAEAEAQTEADAAMDASPIGLIILAIAALVVGIVELVKHWHTVEDAAKDAWKAVSTAAVDAWHFIDDDMIHPLEHGISDLVGWVEGHWKTLAVIIGTVLLGPVGGLVAFVATHWGQIERDTAHLVSDVTGFFERLPGDILHALGDVGHMLWNAGADVLNGLIGGMESKVGSMIHSVESFGSSVLSTIESALGIGSPSKEMRYRGQMTGLGLALGLDDSRSLVEAASRRLAGVVESGFGEPRLSGGAATGGGAAMQQIVLKVEGGRSGLDQLFMTWLKNEIRVEGGDPRILSRKVVIA